MGAGSLGSFIALNLAKLGFNHVEVYDFDIVEQANIPNQFYRIQDIGKPKVEALKEIIKEFADVEIITHNEKVTEETKLSQDMNNLFILTFDSLAMRKMFFNNIKGQYATVLDVRAGGEEFNIRVVNTMREEDVKLWEKSLNIIPTQLPCGARSIIYTNLSVASEVCNIVKKISNQEKYATRVDRHMKGYVLINNQEKEK
jgi:hypothetical protein